MMTKEKWFDIHKKCDSLLFTADVLIREIGTIKKFIEDEYKALEIEENLEKKSKKDPQWLSEKK